ncbi:MAG: DUF3105 domain-containing protein [Myxococcales bacterium]|nr:MAG: DUF3105 domain-containing protein [Myxococcales bacterium]
MQAKTRGARRRWPVGLVALLLLAHCGDDDDGSGTAGSGGGGGRGGDSGAAGAPVIEGERCEATLAQFPQLPSSHVAECSYLGPETFNSEPPSSGNHYGRWAAFKTYTQPVPRGYYVHSLEHGAIVFLYNCPGGCPAEVAVLQQIADALPADPLCDGMGVRRRTVITPDPLLPPGTFAASAWGWTLKATCPDPDDFRAFALDHYAQSYENFCNPGVDVIAAGLAPGCGQAPTP